MKTFLTTTIAICLFALTANAQWTHPGTNVILTTITDYVGIGAGSPTTKLTVLDSAHALQLRIGGVVSGLSPAMRWSGRNAAGTANRGADIQLDAEAGVFNFFAPANSTPVVKAISILMGGKVGINTQTPGTAFDVSTTTSANGIRSLSSATLGTASGGGLSAANSSAVPSASGQQLGLLSFGGISSGTTYKYASQIAGYTSESWSGSTFGSYLTFSTITNGGTTPAERMRVDNAGNLSIGTTDPQGYKLAVNGSAVAVSMTVKLHSAWPDFVFKPAYTLPSLSDVKIYIDKNHHLQGVPTIVEVEKNGINLGEMNTVLLKKVEELTLYAIDQQQQIKVLKEKLEQTKTLEDRIRALEQSKAVAAVPAAKK